MNCDSCLLINSIPSCTDSAEFLLTGITFPNNVSSDITIRFKDLATNRIEYIEITTNGTGEIVGGGIDLQPFMPLMQHYYSIEFLAGAEPVSALLTNPDDTTTEQCCFQFYVYEGLTASDEWPLSSEGCAV